MALPIQKTPIYTLTIPSTKEKFKYRPFLVKEEKALMIAQQSEDMTVMTDTLKAVIKSCAESKISVDDLATFDLEYMFCQIRGKSVGEIIDLIFFCDDCDDEKAGVKFSFDVTKLEVKFDPEHEKKIPLFDDVGVVMKYPNMTVLNQLVNLDTTDTDAVISTIANCIDYIYTNEEVYHSKEQKHEEIVDFINNMTTEQFGKIQKFFDTMPKFQEPVKYTCPMCAKEHNKVLSGISNFF